VVVVCDKRVVTKRYGQQFLSALPTGYRSFATKESLVRSAARFLDRKP
jgi:Rad3-related DNA helicase